ncbi:hypothetical protein PILCRDRAFT_2598 [Piloderma croceum F 1598]|uniref:Uncharacterized protein n=1 Tax=Piloderma croceum (strain F 1598) TaxID=765440 RepID=A0A0C3GCC5_PILCF|nr:hypothetical protein PILCRDRAFT_2598 [Piloderma croceum F 1598]
MFVGYYWGGAISCQIDIYWASVERVMSFTASIIPPSPAKEFDAIKNELNEIWHELVQEHFKG